MGDARVLLDLVSCKFEVEGSEDFVSKELTEIRELLKAGLLPVQQAQAEDEDGPELAPQADGPKRDEEVDDGSAHHAQTAKRRPRQRKHSAYQVITLDLRGSGGNSLQDFVKAKNPKGNPDRYVTVAYWLKTHHSLDEIGDNHIYTCFKTLNWPLPTDIRKIFANAKRRNGFFDVGSKLGMFRLNVVGENRVEHRLPKQGKK